MGTFDRMEIIEEIESLAHSLGVSGLTVMGRLNQQEDITLMKMRDALHGMVESGARA